MIKLYNGNRLLGVYPDYWEAEAAARWLYYTLIGKAYAKQGIPNGFIMLIPNQEVENG